MLYRDGGGDLLLLAPAGEEDLIGAPAAEKARVHDPA